MEKALITKEKIDKFSHHHHNKRNSHRGTRKKMRGPSDRGRRRSQLVAAEADAAVRRQVPQQKHGQ